MDLWLACATEQEIAEAVGLARKTVDERIQVLAESYRDKNSPKLLFQDEFAVPLYNVWKQQETMTLPPLPTYRPPEEPSA